MSEEQSNGDRRQELVQKLRETLQEKMIDKARCQKSLEKYLKEQNGPTTNQKRQFQLGNGQRNRKPLEAAAHLLQREYGDSFLFQKEGESIFIPPVFVSKHHAANHIQDKEMLSEMETQYDQLTDNHWFKKEIKAFFQEQKRKQKLPNNNGSIPNAINNHDFEDWMLRVKIKYLLHEELENEDLRKIPFTMKHHSTESFVRICFEKFSNKDLSISLKKILETMDNLERLKGLVDKEIEKKSIQETIKYFFELEIPQGELVTSLDYDFVNHIKETSKNEEMPNGSEVSYKNFLKSIQMALTKNN
uniref:Uncharacterized protein n=1 Tax=Clytia hemisphaerica TaxID=252671 RepID=A0A7M5V452_9CNID